MLPRPVWLALGVVAAAAAVSYVPLEGGGAVTEAAAAAGLFAAAAIAGHVIRRPGVRASGLSVAALGAALVAARLAAGLALGGGGEAAGLSGASSAGAAAGTAHSTGPWHATVESARLSKGRQIATLDLDEAAVTCQALAPADPRLLAGDRIEWNGRVQALGDGDYDLYLAGLGMNASCTADVVTVLSHDQSPAGFLERFRQASGDAIQQVVPEPGGGLLAAILIGLRDRVDRDVAADFTAAGVSHIVAISGWNIAIVTATVAALLRRRLARRRRAIVTVAAILAYTLFAGAPASVVRAAVMALVAIATLESGRGTRVSVGLAWAAAIMLLAEPATIADVGFLLSAAATAGLVAWATPVTGWLGERAPRLPESIRESLGVSLAAQAATLPIVLAVFGRLALIAPAANLVAVPLVPPVMALGLLALGAGWLQVLGLPPILCGLCALPASLLLTTLISIVGLAAAVPGANQVLAPPWNFVGAGLGIGLVIGIGRWAARLDGNAPAKPRPPVQGAPQRRKPASRRYPLLIGAAGMSVMIGVSIVASAPDGHVHVIVLDVGQGDSILIEGDRGGRVLVDGGPDGNVLISDLDSVIPSWDRRLDAIVLTHPHDDHVTGLVSVLDRYRISAAYESGWPSQTTEYKAWKSALARHGLAAVRLSTGNSLRVDDVSLRVLWPDGTTRPTYLDPDATDNRKTNDSSLVLLGEYEGRRFLLTGDAEDDVDPVLLSRGLPRVDMLKVAHHGSATASSDAMLAALRPGVSVVSVGAGNTYGHPNPGTMARLRSHSARTYRTDQSGTVDVSIDRQSVRVSWSRNATAVEPAAAFLGGSTDSPLLYDSSDVRSQPSRERRAAPLTRSPSVAPAPLARRGRDSGLACFARPASRSAGRSPPRGGRGSSS